MNKKISHRCIVLHGARLQRPTTGQAASEAHGVIVSDHPSDTNACPASCYLNRAWIVSNGFTQSFPGPWAMHHQPWRNPSAWANIRSVRGCTISLSLARARARDFPFRAKMEFSLCHSDTTTIAGPECLTAHLLVLPDRGASRRKFHETRT